MAKFTLLVEPDYDFKLIGISSHEKDYRLCWLLNNELKIDLEKIESLEIKNKKEKTPSFYSSYCFVDDVNLLEYTILANASENKIAVAVENNLFGDDEDLNALSKSEWLVPEYKQMNYFLLIKGELTEDQEEILLAKIKNSSIVQTAIFIDVDNLKSKDNLIF